MGGSTMDSSDVPPLFSAEFYTNPYATYRRLQSGPAAQPLPGRPGVWMIFGYEACTALLKDRRLSAVRPAAALVAVGPGEDLGEFDALVRHMQRWLLLRDAPRHTALRKSLNRGFTPTVIERLRPSLERLVERLLDDCERAESVDLMRDFAHPLPVLVICELLGVPDDLHARCVQLSDEIAVWFGDLRRPPASARIAQRAIQEFEGVFEAIIRRRRTAPRDDLLGILLDAAAADETLTQEDLLAQCVMLLFAGHETTRNLIGNGIHALLEHRRWPELCEDAQCLPAAVEELLRFDCPVQAYGRGVTAELEVGGIPLPAGSSVVFMIGAANRDARQFADPDVLNLRRTHNRHLAFGGDAHVCLGSTLARLEGRLAIGAVTRRFPHLSLEDAVPDWNRNFAFRGLNSLNVRL